MTIIKKIDVSVRSTSSRMFICNSCHVVNSGNDWHMSTKWCGYNTVYLPDVQLLNFRWQTAEFVTCVRAGIMLRCLKTRSWNNYLWQHHFKWTAMVIIPFRETIWHNVGSFPRTSHWTFQLNIFDVILAEFLTHVSVPSRSALHFETAFSTIKPNR